MLNIYLFFGVQVQYKWHQSVWQSHCISPIFCNLYDSLPFCAPSVSISPSIFSCSVLSPFFLAYAPVVTRATAPTCRPMFLWARGPLGASQRASLPGTSGAGGMERALVSALKVNKAAAQHSVSDSQAPQTSTEKYIFERKFLFNHTQI